MSTTIEHSIELAVPARTAYNQWTQLEDFPEFLEDVEEVEQIDDTHVRWRARIGGHVREWEAEISEQIPDKRIAWHSLSGARNAGVVTFHRLSEGRSKVMLQLDYEPEGFIENVGDALGVGKRTVNRALNQFKQFVERRGSETGAWRGEVKSPDERGEPEHWEPS